MGFAFWVEGYKTLGTMMETAKVIPNCHLMAARAAQYRLQMLFVFSPYLGRVIGRLLVASVARIVPLAALEFDCHNIHR